MTGTNSAARTEVPRRRLLELGSGVVTAGVLGGMRASGTADGTSGTERTTADPTHLAAMYPHQYAPESPCTICDRGVEWRPSSLDERYETHVVSYDRFPSLRALVFADPAGFRGVESFRLEPTDGSRAVPAPGGMMALELVPVS